MKRYIKSAIVNILSEPEEIRREIADSSDSSAANLLQLASDPDFSVRSSVACNPNAPYRALKVLSRDRDHRIRLNIAERFDTPSILLKKIILDDSDTRVRQSALNNSNLADNGLDLIYELSQHPDFVIRAGIAKNDKTPTDVLVTLAKDSNWVVRRSVAENFNTPKTLLTEMLKDKNPYVAEAARSTL